MIFAHVAVLSTYSRPSRYFIPAYTFDVSALYLPETKKKLRKGEERREAPFAFAMHYVPVHVQTRVSFCRIEMEYNGGETI